MARTHEQFVNELNKINPDIEVIGQYTKVNERINVRCRVCGKEWSPMPYSLLSGKGCPHCSAIKGAETNQGKTGRKGLQRFLHDFYVFSSDSDKNIDNTPFTRSTFQAHC